MLFRDCATDSACNKAFPNLKQRFSGALQTANQTPVSLTVSHPKDSTQQTLQLRGADLANLIDLGSTWNLPNLPLLIDQICRKDYSGLTRLLKNRYSAGGYAWGMRYCVWCSEELPFAQPKRIGQQANLYPETVGLPSTVIPATVCQAWQVDKAPAIANQPVTSSIPTLLICGEYDPDTPSRWGRIAAQTLANSYVLVMKGMSHNPTQFWDNLCGMELAQLFLNNPTKGPASSCYESLKAPSFVTEAKK
jgi:pimeloyl-ACP methyl ester carboxylesterase